MKIPMTEKVCQLYEEEQLGKAREGRKAVPASKMPNLGWDIAESQLQETQEKPENKSIHTTLCFQVLITIAIIITTIIGHIAVYIPEIPEIAKKTVQTVKRMTMKANRNILMQNIKDSYKTAALVITIATGTMDHTNHTEKPQTHNRNTPVYPGMRKLNNEYNKSYQSHTSRTHHKRGN